MEFLLGLAHKCDDVKGTCDYSVKTKFKMATMTSPLEWELTSPVDLWVVESDDMHYSHRYILLRERMWDSSIKICICKFGPWVSVYVVSLTCSDVCCLCPSYISHCSSHKVCRGIQTFLFANENTCSSLCPSMVLIKLLNAS